MQVNGLESRSVIASAIAGVVAGAAGALLVLPGAGTSGVTAGAVVGLLLGGLAGWVASRQAR